MGRVKVIDKGPRNIDLDILMYEDFKFTHPRLQLPHALMLEREFVLRPLLQYVIVSYFNTNAKGFLISDFLNKI